MNPLSPQPQGQPTFEHRLRKRLTVTSLGMLVLFLAAAAGLLLSQQAGSGSRAEATRIVNEIRALGSTAQKLILQAIRSNQAGSANKERSLEEARSSIEQLNARWARLQAIPQVSARTPDLVSALDPKVVRLSKRIESILEIKPGVPLTREDFESLYLLHSELLDQADRMADYYTAESQSSLKREMLFGWSAFGALTALSALALLIVHRAIASPLAVEAGRLEKSNRTLGIRDDTADQRAREKSFFVSHAGQRLRKAVTEIVEHAATLENQLIEKQQGENADYAAWIRVRGTQILEVINDMLNLAFIESGSVHLMPRAVNLTRLLQDMTEHLKPRAEDKGLVYTFNPASEEVWAMGDPDQIWRMVEKIFDNAVKYTDHGEASITLSLRPDGRATVAIRDTGRGISPEALPEIFEPQPFEEEKETRLEEGLGINLSVSRQLAALMGSDISVHSDLDKGTTFLIDMPACTPDGKLLVT